ncbi:MAG: GTP cyclohydrolase I FolE [Elusimicrobia bacterium RIFCSPLOWO2_01_FULL_60_11]|nr:MAG: GTP cyclohydrolase I FolE [Elusimicrobia bacterium RIFCSPLOWO2_01_FULL_60_11]
MTRRKQNIAAIEPLIKSLLSALGEDPKREGLARTPKRVAEAFRFLTSGYQKDAQKTIERATFQEKYNQMVVIKDIDFFSLCEHHLLPFYGKCHVAYIPNGRVIGLSKIPRVVDIFSRRVQIQERMTQEIAQAIEKHLRPRGVGVVVEAFHLCMAMRGVERQNAYATTSAMLGAFESHERTRLEFLSFIRREASR